MLVGKRVYDENDKRLSIDVRLGVFKEQEAWCSSFWQTTQMFPSVVMYQRWKVSPGTTRKGRSQYQDSLCLEIPALAPAFQTFIRRFNELNDKAISVLIRGHLFQLYLDSLSARATRWHQDSGSNFTKCYLLHSRPCSISN